jgi:hypothetical protein
MRMEAINTRLTVLFITGPGMGAAVAMELAYGSTLSRAGLTTLTPGEGSPAACTHQA